MKRHSNHGLKFTVFHKEKHFIHGTIKTQVQIYRLHSIGQKRERRVKISSYNTHEPPLRCLWYLQSLWMNSSIFLLLLRLIDYFLHVSTREKVNYKLQWMKGANDSVHLQSIVICFSPMKKAHNGTRCWDPYVFIFDTPSAEDLITGTHSWQESSSFPMETEDACGTSLQIITSVIKIHSGNASLVGFRCCNLYSLRQDSFLEEMLVSALLSFKGF